MFSSLNIFLKIPNKIHPSNIDLFVISCFQQITAALPRARTYLSNIDFFYVLSSNHHSITMCTDLSIKYWFLICVFSTNHCSITTCTDLITDHGKHSWPICTVIHLFNYFFNSLHGRYTFLRIFSGYGNKINS
jgi:hypothetical protein